MFFGVVTVFAFDHGLNSFSDLMSIKISVCQSVKSIHVINSPVQPHAEMLNPCQISADGFVLMGLVIGTNLENLRRPISIQVIKYLGL